VIIFKTVIFYFQTEITEITEFLQTDAPEIEHLVKKRQLKRKAQKSQRGKARRLTLLLISERQAKHRQIDAWRQEQQDIVEKIKRVGVHFNLPDNSLTQLLAGRGHLSRGRCHSWRRSKQAV